MFSRIDIKGSKRKANMAEREITARKPPKFSSKYMRFNELPPQQKHMNIYLRINLSLNIWRMKRLAGVAVWSHIEFWSQMAVFKSTECKRGPEMTINQLVTCAVALPRAHWIKELRQHVCASPQYKHEVQEGRKLLCEKVCLCVA